MSGSEHLCFMFRGSLHYALRIRGRATSGRPSKLQCFLKSKLRNAPQPRMQDIVRDWRVAGIAAILQQEGAECRRRMAFREWQSGDVKVHVCFPFEASGFSQDHPRPSELHSAMSDQTRFGCNLEGNQKGSLSAGHTEDRLTSDRLFVQGVGA